MGIGDEEKRFDALAWWLHRHGIRPDHISLLQVPVYGTMLAVGYASAREYVQGVHRLDLLWIFGWLQVAATVIDGADGILARRTGTVTRHGHLLDALFDIAGIGLTIWIVSLHHPELSQWLLALLIINFLVYIQNEIQGTKSITYTRGPLTLGFVLNEYYGGLLVVGLALPIFVGTVLLFTRVAWRKRFWTYYQFLTAGKREEYKATPRAQRVALLSNDPRLSAPWISPKGSDQARDGDGAEETEEPPPEPTPISQRRQ